MDVYRPSGVEALGNLSLSLATHFLQSENPAVHEDVYKYGRDRWLKIDRVVKDGEGTINYKGILNSFLHLSHPGISDRMRQCIQPTEELHAHVDWCYEKVKHCVAAFHIRMGLNAEDSAKFAQYPAASMDAVEAMISYANTLDKPVYVLSDSDSTKAYFMSKVPKAVCMDFEIGFTACEKSQVERSDDDAIKRRNSFTEWFLLSKMPVIYTTMGGVNHRNMMPYHVEGVSSTFAYSAGIYGSVPVWYVFNDGCIFYPNGKSKPFERHFWSDREIGKFILLDNPTDQNKAFVERHLGMWTVVEELPDRFRYALRWSGDCEMDDLDVIRQWVVSGTGGELRPGLTGTKNVNV